MTPIRQLSDLQPFAGRRIFVECDGYRSSYYGWLERSVTTNMQNGPGWAITVAQMPGCGRIGVSRTSIRDEDLEQDSYRVRLATAEERAQMRLAYNCEYEIHVIDRIDQLDEFAGDVVWMEWKGSVAGWTLYQIIPVPELGLVAARDRRLPADSSLLLRRDDLPIRVKKIKPESAAILGFIL